MSGRIAHGEWITDSFMQRITHKSDAIRIRKFDHIVLASLRTVKNAKRRALVSRDTYRQHNAADIIQINSTTTRQRYAYLPAKCLICTLVTGSRWGYLRHRRARSERRRAGEATSSSPWHAIDHFEVQRFDGPHGRHVRHPVRPRDSWRSAGRPVSPYINHVLLNRNV